MTISRTASALALAAILAGCGSGSTGSGAAAGAPSSTASASDQAVTTSNAGIQRFNDADVEFAQNMIPHHEQAITMADLALDPKAGASPAVVDLARQIKAAQAPEVATMTAWLGLWGRPTTTGMAGHDMDSMAGHGAAGMMSTESMNRLRGLNGRAFDQAWLQMMIEHHQGAITMSEAVRTAGANPAVATLAGQIITAQQGEIATMNGLLSAS